MRRVALTKHVSPENRHEEGGEAYFHMFAVVGSSEYGIEAVAIVERDDGRVESYATNHIRFLEPPTKIGKTKCTKKH